MPLLTEADGKSFDNKQLNAQLQLNLEEIDLGAGNCAVKLPYTEFPNTDIIL